MIKQLIYFQDSETNKEGVFFCVSVLGPYHCPKNFSICGFEISRIRAVICRALRSLIQLFEDQINAEKWYTGRKWLETDQETTLRKQHHLKAVFQADNYVRIQM